MQNASENHTGEKRERAKYTKGTEEMKKESIVSYSEKKILSTITKLWRLGARNLCRLVYE
jgi:hypothetical protein